MKVLDIITSYHNGDTSLLDATIELRTIRESLEAQLDAIKQFENENLAEYEQYKGYKHMGYEFQVVNGRKTYDFSNCSTVKMYQSKVKEAQDIAKNALELYLKTGQKPITEDGEELELPEVKYGAGYLKVIKSK